MRSLVKESGVGGKLNLDLKQMESHLRRELSRRFSGLKLQASGVLMSSFGFLGVGFQGLWFWGVRVWV